MKYLSIIIAAALCFFAAEASQAAMYDVLNDPASGWGPLGANFTTDGSGVDLGDGTIASAPVPNAPIHTLGVSGPGWTPTGDVYLTFQDFDISGPAAAIGLSYTTYVVFPGFPPWPQVHFTPFVPMTDAGWPVYGPDGWQIAVLTPEAGAVYTNFGLQGISQAGRKVNPWPMNPLDANNGGNGGAVPEPASLVMFAFAIAGGWVGERYRKK